MKQNSEKNWYIFDASKLVLGRLSTQVADILRGKNKTTFANNTDGGDYVVVINAAKVKLTGNKENQKRYYKHSGYIGNLKEKTLPEMRAKNPEQIVIHAVTGMLPDNKLREGFLKRLKVYPGANHPHVNVKFINQE